MELKRLLAGDGIGLRLSIAVFFLGVIAFIITGYSWTLLAAIPWFYLLLAIRNWKLAYWILIASIPLSVRLPLAGNTLSITLPAQPMMWLFLVLSIILIAHRPDRFAGWFWSNPVTIIVVFQYLWLLVAVMHSQVVFYSIKFLIAKTWMLASCFIMPLFIFRQKKDFRTAFFLLLIPTLTSVLIILIRHANVGFRFADISYAVGQVYYNHVEYSTFISMIFPVLLIAFPLIARQNKKQRAILIILILLISVAIFLSYARAAVLAAIFAVTIGVAIRVRLVNWIMPGFYALIILLLAYVVRDFNYMKFTPHYERTVMHHDFSEHMAATFRGQDVSSMERVYRWVAAIRMGAEKPLVGFGPHGFYYHYRQYAFPAFKTVSSANVEKSTTHNYFLLLLTEQGLPAMLLYALLTIVAFAQAQTTYHRLKDPFYKNCTLGAAMMFAASFVNNFFSELIETHKVGSLFYLSLALLIVLHRKSNSPEPTTDTASIL
jgi:O-antigen ligase